MTALFLSGWRNHAVHISVPKVCSVNTSVLVYSVWGDDKAHVFSISFITNNQTVSKVVLQERPCVVSTDFCGGIDFYMDLK